MKIAVCGGRNFGVNAYPEDNPAYQDAEDTAEWQQEFLGNYLTQLNTEVGIEEIVHGGANGADSLAGYWAAQNKIPTTVFKAAWRTYGKSAGFRRNIQIAAYKPDLLIAFTGGAGTAHMISIAKEQGIEVREPK